MKREGVRPPPLASASATTLRPRLPPLRLPPLRPAYPMRACTAAVRRVSPTLVKLRAQGHAELSRAGLLMRDNSILFYSIRLQYAFSIGNAYIVASNLPGAAAAMACVM